MATTQGVASIQQTRQWDNIVEGGRLRMARRLRRNDLKVECHIGLDSSVFEACIGKYRRYTDRQLIVKKP